MVELGSGDEEVPEVADEGEQNPQVLMTPKGLTINVQEVGDVRASSLHL